MEVPMPTATFDADQIVIGGNATIWIAALGTPLPTSVDSALNAAWRSLGFTGEDGVKFMDEKTVKEIRAHQSFYPIKRVIEARSGAAEFTMLEWDHKTVPFAFGGGSWTTVSAGKFRFTPPAAEVIDERSMVIDVADGSVLHRITIPKGLVTSNTEATFSRATETPLKITFSITADGTNSPWIYDTNSPAADAVEAGS
jgi:hypothetical protein